MYLAIYHRRLKLCLSLLHPYLQDSRRSDSLVIFQIIVACGFSAARPPERILPSLIFILFYCSQTATHTVSHCGDHFTSPDHPILRAHCNLIHVAAHSDFSHLPTPFEHKLSQTSSALLVGVSTICLCDYIISVSRTPQYPSYPPLLEPRLNRVIVSHAAGLLLQTRDCRVI